MLDLNHMIALSGKDAEETATVLYLIVAFFTIRHLAIKAVIAEKLDPWLNVLPEVMELSKKKKCMILSSDAEAAYHIERGILMWTYHTYMQ